MANTPDAEDRRDQGRSRATLTANCRVGDQDYRSRIFEISHAGMTLVCDPNFPEVNEFEVTCRLKSSREFAFDVRLRNRQQLERGNMKILRLGLTILNPGEMMDDFLCELALQRMRELKMEAAQLDSETDDTGASARGFQRLAFQLPATARIEGTVYRCKTLDVSTGGLRLWVPDNFPRVNVFVLSYEVPDGLPVVLTAGVRNRRLDAEGGWQLGLRVMSGNREFGAFLQRYDIWKAPEV